MVAEPNCLVCGKALSRYRNGKSKYCYDCSRAPNVDEKGTRRSATSPEGIRVAAAPAPGSRARKCEHCGKDLPRTLRSDARYCSKAHAQYASAKRRRRREKQARGLLHNQGPGSGLAAETVRANDTPLVTDLSKGAGYGGTRAEIKTALVAEGLFVRYQDDELRQIDLARMLNVSQSQIKRALDELYVDMANNAEAANWTIAPDVARMLGTDRLDPDDRSDPATCLAWATEMADAFLDFEARFFSIAGSKPWLRKDFHRTWVIETLLAYISGGYLQIMAPPRHGKSALLTHLCVWLICRNPAVRILWVGPSSDIAEDFVWTVAEILDQNVPLVEATLPPGQSYAPPKRGPGSNWTRQQITVACRPYGITGATMVAVGRGGRILSRNADWIVCDDIEDARSTAEPAARKKTRHWFSVTLDSRKEEWTPLIVIGSRQHEDDLYGYNLDDPNFRCVVNSAHDPACHLNPDDVAAHTDCVLFPEVRTYRWLRTKQTGAAARISEDEEEGLYEMVYLNDPTIAVGAYYTPGSTDTALNRLRGVGLGGIPHDGRRLVAGLDPATSGYQAAFLWAVTPIDLGVAEIVLDDLRTLRVQDTAMRRWMVDLENRRGGGIEEALDQMEQWRIAYDLKHWVIEDQAMQKGFTQDPRIRLYARTHDIHIEGHSTYLNKYDPKWGLGSFVRLFKDNLIDLPYGDEEARRKTDTLRQQMYKFDGKVESERKRRRDVHMASWFPQKAIRRYEKELIAANSERVTQLDSAYPTSYPTLGGFTGHLNQAPWSS